MQTDITMTFTYPSFMKISKLPNKENALMLYFFYYATAKYQHTNRPWATISFCAQGLGWGEDRVREAKKSLIKAGLIKEIHASGKKGKSYIQIMFADGVGMFCEIEDPCTGENNQAKKKGEQDLCTGGFAGGREIGSQMLMTRKENAYDKNIINSSYEESSPPDSNSSDDQPLEYNGLLCPKCKEPQFTCRSGDTCINGHGGMIGIEKEEVKPKTLFPKFKKIVKTPNPFDYSPEALKIVTHWSKRGGKVHYLKSAGNGIDKIKNAIEELLGMGLNTCYMRYTRDQGLKKKQWTVKEIISSIDVYTEVKQKATDSMYFSQFVEMIYHGNASRNFRNHSPLLDSFRDIPDEQTEKWQRLLRKKFKELYASVEINSTTLLNCSKFLVEHDKIYQVVNSGVLGNHIVNLYVAYMRKLVTQSGTMDPLKYMSGQDNLDDFIKHTTTKSFKLKKRSKVA